MGLGETVTNFNISLGKCLATRHPCRTGTDRSTVEGFNQTGNGTVCWNKIRINAAANKIQPIQDGDLASIQVIQISHSGASLYNCADIVFRSNATVLSGDQCRNSTGIGGYALQNAAASTSNSTTGSGTTTGGAGTGKEVTIGMIVGGLAIAFAGLM